MRIYGSVQVCFWENSEIQNLTDQAKLLAIYLLTGPHSNMLGCFRLPDGYIIEDLNWDNKTVKNAFQQLSLINYITRDENLSWLLIHDFLKWNSIQNPRQGIGIQKLFNAVPSQSIVCKPLINALLTYGKYFDKEFVDRLHTLQKLSETLSEDCVADKEQNQNQDQEQDQNKEKIFMSGKKNHVNQTASITKKNLLKSQACEVLQFLNEKTGRVYRPVDTNLKLIMARLNSGATVIDCRQVIAKKTREWKNDCKMAEYLRPATLFNATKFEQYMGELVIQNEDQNNDSK